MPELIDFKILALVALIFVPLEAILPLDRTQKVLRRHWLNDLFYFLFNGIPIRLGLVIAFALAAAAARAALPGAIGIWLRNQPLWLQVGEILVLADLGFYLAHRAFHAVPALWKFHAIHHSIEELDWLAAYRVHPLDQIATMAASYGPVLALGYSPEATAIALMLYQWHSLLIHANTRIDFGPLNRIIASPLFHRWHHADDAAARDSNFGGQLALIDWLFGTLILPPHMPARYGTDEVVPDWYSRQLVWPFRVASAAAVGVAGDD